MAKTFSDLISNRKKAREEEERNKISSSDNGKTTIEGIIEKSSLKKSIGLDTFESDLADMGNKINSIYGEWQTPETMANTRVAVESMQKRVNDYATYQKKYAPDNAFDADSLLKGYQTVLNDWDKLAETYSTFKDAESYKNYPNYQKSLEEKNKKKDERVKALDNSFDQYKYYEEMDDFEERSQYKSTIENKKFLWMDDRYIGDEVYEYINNADGKIRGELLAQHDKYQANAPIYTPSKYAEMGLDYLTEEEKRVYNAIYSDGGKEAANKFLEDMKVTLTKRATEASEDLIKKETDGSALNSALLSAVSIPMRVGGGIYSGIENLSGLVTGESNPYSIYNSMSNQASAIRKNVGENIEEATEGAEIFGQNIPKFIYDTSMSIGDSALGVASLGKAFTPIMSANAYQQTAREMTEAGEDEETIQKMALANAFSEAFFEKFSIDNVLKINNVDGVKNFLKSVAKQSGIEASEEMFTEISNLFWDDVIRGDGSDLISQYNDLLARGYSEEEAKSEVHKQANSQIGWALAGGALSGGVMGVGGSVNSYHNLKEIGSNIRNNDRVSEMMDVAGDAFMSLSEKDAYNLYTEYANKGVNAENINDAQLGNLYASVAQNVEDVSHSKKATPQEQNDIKRQIEGLAKVDAAKTEAEKSRETRVKALNTGEVTEVTATGNSAKIEGIRIEDGKTLLQTNEGEVSTENMTFSQNDAELLAYAEGMGEVKGSLLMAQYDGKTDVESYVNSFEMAYAYGETGFGSESVLKNKGVLSESQASAIYASAMTSKAKAQQSAIDAINQKYSANTEYHGTVDDSSINYENLTTTQRDAVNFVKSFAQVTGMNVKLFESKVVDGKRVGKNGSYNKTTNTIEIDVHAGIMDAKTLNDTIIPTMSHEVTHWMKAKAPTMYNNMREIVMNTLSVDGLTSEHRVAAEMKRMRDAHPDMEVTEDDAIDEIVAKGCEDMLSNSQKARDIMSNLSETEQKSLIDKVKSTFKNLIDWVNDLLSKYKSKSHEAQILRQYKESLQKLSEAWDQALTEAIQTNKALTAEGITGEQVIGENLFTETTAQLSMRTYENEGRELLHKWLENSDLDAETKTEIIEQMDHVYNVAAKYAEDNSLVDFGSWSETDIIRGADGSPLLSVVVPNGDYPLNIDFSQVCKKRKTLNAVLNALVRSGDLDFRSLSQGDINSINRIIKEHGFEIACALCFVDSKRYRVNDWADSFTDTYNKLVKSLTKGTDFVVDEFNYTGRPVKGVEGKLLKDADDSELNFDYINEVLAKNSSGKAIYRYALAIKNNKDLRSILRSSEIISSAGLDAIKVENRTLYDLVNSHQGSAKPKLAHGEVPYAYDILLQKKFNAEDAYKVGGVRMQSFSDYMANMFFDYVQMIGDLSAKQLPAHAYTKEYYFAKLFGLTGIKINLSVVPKGADITEEQKARFNKMTKAAKDKDPEFKRLKSHAGLDENGNYILEDETFPLDKALEIQNTEGYDKNCGIIWVGVSNKHIEKMLDDPNVPYIIPYHKSSLNPLIARMRNIDFYNDYTKAQNTRYDTKAKKKVPASIWSFDFYGDLAKTNDPRTTAENYKRECRERGYLPKFDDFASHPNYYKLLIDFRVYDNKGNYAPQGAVQMKFPDNFNEIVGESLREAQDTSARLDASMEGLLSDIRKELNIEHKQFSDRDSDGNTLTAEQMEYFKDSKVRDAEGNLLVVYHGTRSGGFNEFSHDAIGSATDYGYLGRGFYFTGRESVAKYYAGYLNSSEVKKGYVNVTNPIILPDKRDLAYYMESLMESGSFDILYEEDANYERSIAFTKWLKDNGYDGVICKDEIMVLNSNQFKNIDNTNPTEDADIRYSDRYEDAFFDLFDSDGTFAESSAIIEDDVNRLKQRLSMGASSMSAENIKMIAKHLLQKADSRYDFEELTDDIKDIFEYIRTSKNLDSNTLIAKCKDVASRILAYQNGEKVSRDYAKMVLKEIRSGKISTSKEQLEGIKDRYGDKYNNAIIGRIPRSNNGVSLDSKWAEWSKKYPGIFDANIESKDMLTELDDIVKAMQSASDARHVFEEAVDTTSLGAEIYSQMWLRSTTDVKTDADKQRLKELNFAHRKAIDNVRNNLTNRQIDSMRMVQIIDNLKQKNKADVAKAKKLGKEHMDAYKDRVARKAKIEKITNTSLTLNNWIKKNSKDHPVPEILKKPVVHLLDAIDFSSKQMLRSGKPTQKDNKLALAFAEVEKMALKIDATNARIEKSEVEDMYINLPSGLVYEIEQMSNTVNALTNVIGDSTYVLNDMSLEELEKFDMIITTLKNIITSANECHKFHYERGIKSLASNLIGYLEKFSDKKVSNLVSNFFEYDNATPLSVFKRLGEHGMVMFESFQDSWDTFAIHIKDIKDFTGGNKKKGIKAAYTKNEVKEWRRKTETFTVLDTKRSTKDDPKYKKVTMTHAQIMGLYLLDKREQAKGHIYGGGIRIADINLKGKANPITDAEGFTVKKSDVDSFISVLSDRQIEVADKLSEFMNTVCSDWGNEITMALYGVKSFTEKNYYPIKTDENSRAVKGHDDDTSIYRLLNMAFTKVLTPNANNKVVVDDIFNVFSSHCSDMAKYNAFALAVTDFLKVYSYNSKIYTGIKENEGSRKQEQYNLESMQTSIERAFGKGMKKYLRTFLEDVNSSQSGGRGEEISKKMMSNYKIAAVGASLSVAALQPLSYARASMVLPAKYLLFRGNMLHWKRGSEKALEHSGIAIWKSLGFYDTDVARGVQEQITHDESLKDKLTEASMTLAEKGDRFTWGALWNACELEVKDRRKDLKYDSPEFNKEVALKFREVVYATQVVDSTMTRTQMMRSKSGLTQTLTAFMSEPSLTYNMVADAFFEWSIDSRRGYGTSVSKHGKKFAKAVSIYAVTALLSAAVRSGVDIIRDDDEEEENLDEYLANLKENAISELNPLSKLPIFKDVVSIFEGYDPARLDEQSLVSIKRAYDAWKKVIKDDKDVDYKVVYKTLQAISQTSGLPLSNAYRDVVAMWNTSIGNVYPSLKVETK